MDPLTRMTTFKDEFSATDLKIYTKIRTDPYYVTQSGIVGLAAWCGVSQPSITRFCKRVGYSKFSNFKQEMYRFILGSSKSNIQNGSLLNDTSPLFDLLVITDNFLTEELLTPLSKDLISSNNIYFTGIVESGLVGRLLTYKLRRLGLKCFFIEPTELTDTTYFGSPTDAIVMFSARGPVSGNELGNFMNSSYKFNGSIYLITMNKDFKNNAITKQITLPKSTNFNISSNFSFQYFAEKLISNIANNI